MNATKNEVSLDNVTINFKDMVDVLKTLHITLLDQINDRALPVHFTKKTLKQLNLIDGELTSIPDNFHCLTVLPSIQENKECTIITPCLYKEDNELFVVDSSLTNQIKVNVTDIREWTLGLGNYAYIAIDKSLWVVSTSYNIDGVNGDYKNFVSINSDMVNIGDLNVNWLKEKPCPTIPLKARCFKENETYTLIGGGEKRATYFEENNQVEVETGLLFDVQIGKTILKNVIANSKLERLAKDKNFNFPIDFKIVKKSYIGDKKNNKISVLIVDPTIKVNEVSLDNLDL